MDWTSAAERVPMIVFPRAPLHAYDWYTDASACIARYLPRHGSMLFRGFAVDDQAERALIRTLAARREDTLAIAPWGPTGEGLGFVRCREPACDTGLVDLRELYRALAGATRVRLVDRGVRYVRRLHAADWQKLFATAQRELVEAWCEKNDTAFEWLDAGVLRLSRREPAVTKQRGTLACSARLPRFLGAHPHSGRELRYADGAPIERNLLADLEHSLTCVSTLVAWEQGDLLVVDRTLASSVDVWEWEDTPGLLCKRLEAPAHLRG